MTCWLTNSPIHRKEALLNLGDSVPQTPWDLARFCHPRWGLKIKHNRGQALLVPGHGLAPEVGAQVASLRCPTLRSGPVQCKPEEQHQNPESYVRAKKR